MSTVQESSSAFVGQLWSPGQALSPVSGASALVAQDTVRGRFDTLLKSYEHAEIRAKEMPVERATPETGTALHLSSSFADYHKTDENTLQASTWKTAASGAGGVVQSNTHGSATPTPTGAMRSSAVEQEASTAVKASPKSLALARGAVANVGSRTPAVTTATAQKADAPPDRQNTQEETKPSSAATDEHSAATSTAEAKAAREPSLRVDRQDGAPQQKSTAGADDQAPEMTVHSASIKVPTQQGAAVPASEKDTSAQVQATTQAPVVAAQSGASCDGDDAGSSDEVAVTGVSEASAASVSQDSALADPAPFVEISDKASEVMPPPEEAEAPSTHVAPTEAEPQSQQVSEADGAHILHETTNEGHRSVIHMNLVEQGRVRVAVHDSVKGEQHVHIAAEDPLTLQALSQDTSALVAALNQTTLPGQAASADVHVTLSLLGQHDLSAGDEPTARSSDGPEDAQDDARSVPSNSNQQTMKTSRWMRGVVDLTA